MMLSVRKKKVIQKSCVSILTKCNATYFGDFMTNSTIKDAVQNAIGNLNNEAYYPLIRFAKEHLKIEIEKSSRNMIVNWAKKYIFQNGEFHLAKRVLSSLDKTIAYVQDSLRTANPRYAKHFFNYIKDKYAQNVVNRYLSSDERKAALVDAAVGFAKKGIVEKIFGKFKKSGIRLPDVSFKALKIAIQNLINEIEDAPKSLTNINVLKGLMKTLPENAQRIVLDTLLQKKSLAENSIARFSNNQPGALIDDFQAKIKSFGLHVIKRAQAQKVCKYDGLIERALPASMRGLYDVDKKVVENIAINGDTSKDEDLFNYEVASKARHNATYKVGHTGPSNRSATTLANIAMYFASKHGLAHGKPNSTWIMIYESTKGINTTELVDEKVNWTEFEFVTPQLKSNRFLGAVKFEVDDALSNGRNIAFKAVDGFVAPKVHQGTYRKEGVEGDIKTFLELAKHFDQPALSPTVPNVTFKLPKSTKKLSEERTFFQRIFDKLGLSHKPEQYTKERSKQYTFVQKESDKQKAARLKKEKADLSFWQAFSDQLEQGTTYIKSWLPSFNAMVKKLEPEQKKEVVVALKKKMKV